PPFLLFSSLTRPPPLSTLFPYTTLFRSDRVFDLGCGTGTMAVIIKKQFPQVEVVGLDPDPRALARACKKAARESLTIQFDQGFGDQLPYPAASFDRALSAFMFHHLPAEE